MIPILDLIAQYHSLKADLDAAISDVLESGTFIMGPNVEAFEREIAAYLGVAHAISLNSGTDALHLALRALGIGPGDEVITTPFTFVATTEAIGIVGAKPVFVDIDPTSFNIDPSQVASAITDRTKAIMPVHLYGAPAQLPELQEIAREAAVAVVEDCAQAIGARLGGKQVGTTSTIGCFSFFPSKNLGAFGDGGLVTTNDPSLADRMRALRVHGGRTKYYHDELGVNSRLDELQAAILRVKLRHLDSWIDKRREVARRYDRLLLENTRAVAPVPQEGHVYHQYTVRVADRDDVRQRLAQSGVQTMVYYPVPLHLQNVHKDIEAGLGSFPNAERAAESVLSLPMYPELSVRAQEEVVEALDHATSVVAVR